MSTSATDEQPAINARDRIGKGGVVREESKRRGLLIGKGGLHGNALRIAWKEARTGVFLGLSLGLAIGARADDAAVFTRLGRLVVRRRRLILVLTGAFVVVAAVVYLASDESAFTTGVAHVIDGGWTRSDSASSYASGLSICSHSLRVCGYCTVCAVKAGAVQSGRMQARNSRRMFRLRQAAAS